MKKKLNLYTVRLPEMHIQEVQVIAHTEKDAISQVIEGEGEYLGPSKYQQTITDDDTWKVKAELEYELSEYDHERG